MSADDFPPRGSGRQGDAGQMPDELWAHPWQLHEGTWTWQAGKLLLGEWRDDRGKRHLTGIDDDRHVVTLAQTRAGKTRTTLVPNLERYPGSALILDPKGEIYRKTHKARAALGHRIIRLDPFGVTGEPSHCFNPFDELRRKGKADHVVSADAAQLADAMIINTGGDTHWTDAGKNLLLGTVLHLLEGKAPTIRELRRVLSGDQDRLQRMFSEMVTSQAYDGVVANTGSSFLGKLAGSEKEFQGILSSVQEQTARLDEVSHIMGHSDFALADLKREPITLYLILPGTRMATHYRWLRIIVQLAIAAMEAEPTREGSLPVWFVLEEFATLGHMRSLEVAAGFMAGMHVKLWTVLQDISQLKSIYPNSWETFLGNAGIIQCFGNSDVSTTEFISKMLGETTVMEVERGHVSSSTLASGDLGRRERPRQVPLLTPAEVRRYFSRETERQLIFSPGRPPIYLDRFQPE